MHKRRGRPERSPSVRASTGLTTHRPAGARVWARCHGSRDPPVGRDREPVCEPHDSTGEPGAGNRPAGFGEREQETCPWESDCGPAAKAPDEPPNPTGYAPPLDSTGTPGMSPRSRTELPTRRGFGRNPPSCPNHKISWLLESPRYPISTESSSGFVEAPFLGRMESVGRPSRYSPPVRERQQRSLQICTSLGEGEFRLRP